MDFGLRYVLKFTPYQMRHFDEFFFSLIYDLKHFTNVLTFFLSSGILNRKDYLIYCCISPDSNPKMMGQ